MGGQIDTEAGAGQIAELQATARRQLLVLGELGQYAVGIDHQQGDPRRRVLRVGGRNGNAGEENSDQDDEFHAAAGIVLRHLTAADSCPASGLAGIYNPRMQRLFQILTAAACLLTVALVSGQGRPRARDLGVAPGVYTPGALNAITDVDGVRVGHTTVIEGDNVRTGVTAIVPHGGNVFQDKVAGAVFVGNAFGKLAGSTQVTELGTIETPIVLTNTLSVGVAMDAVVRYTIAQPGNEQVRSVNALVGETNDGGLNDIRGLHVTRDHVLDAIASAKSGPVAEGTVGAGTGTICYGWKGGIGTSSRKLTRRRLHRRRAGADQFRRQPDDRRRADLPAAAADAAREAAQRRDPARRLVHARRRHRRAARRARSRPARRPRRVRARRAPDRPTATAAATSRSRSRRRPRCAAASTRPRARARQVLPTDATSPLFEAALEATEEAVYNSLFQATTVRSASGTRRGDSGRQGPRTPEKVRDLSRLHCSRRSRRGARRAGDLQLPPAQWT